MRPPACFTGADAEEPAEEATVPWQADRDRLVQRVAAPAAEVADRVVPFAALAADEVAGMPASRRFHRARRRARPGHGRRDGRRPSRHRFIGGRRWWGGGDRGDGGAHAPENGGRGGGGRGGGRGPGGARAARPGRRGGAAAADAPPGW